MSLFGGGHPGWWLGLGLLKHGLESPDPESACRPLSLAAPCSDRTICLIKLHFLSPEMGVINWKPFPFTYERPGNQTGHMDSSLSLPSGLILHLKYVHTQLEPHPEMMSGWL